MISWDNRRFPTCGNGRGKGKTFCLLLLLRNRILERVKVSDSEMMIITEEMGMQMMSLLKGM